MASDSWLSRLSIRYGANAKVTLLYFNGYAGKAKFTGGLNLHGAVERGSMFEPFIDQHIVTVDHADHRLTPKEWEQRFKDLALQLEELGCPVIVAGLSRGAQVAALFYDWYCRLEEAKQTLPSLDLVMFSMFTHYNQLQPGLARFVRVMRGYQGGPASRWLLRTIAWRFFLTRTDKCALGQQGRGWIIPLWGESIRASTWIFAAISEIAYFTDLGPVPSLEGSLVWSAQLPAECDETIQVAAAMPAIRRAFPGLTAKRELVLNASHHGAPELDGQAYAAILQQALAARLALM